MDSEKVFNYNKDMEFKIYINYMQSGDSEPYIFRDILTINNLDFIRKSQLTGDYKNDLYVYYKQVMSKIYRKYGKLKPGSEVAIVNDEVLYVNDFNPFEKPFRYEKDLDSPDNLNYLDERNKPGEYSFI